MGAGASAGVADAILKASDDELSAALKALPTDVREKLKASLEPPAWKPSAEPIEYELGGDIDTSIILLHGIGGTGAFYAEGKVNEKIQVSFFNSKDFLQSAGVKGARVVCLTSGTTTNPKLLAFLKDGGKGDGVVPQQSWTDQFKDFDDPKQGFDWGAPDLVGAVAYVQEIIRSEIKRGIKADRVFLLAHSQGGAIATRSALTFPDASLGGIIMLSAWHASTDIAAVTAAPQKSLKIFAAHSASDSIATFPGVKAMCEYLKDAVGASNFNSGGEIIEEEDNPEQMKFHAPFVPSIAEKVGAFLSKAT